MNDAVIIYICGAAFSLFLFYFCFSVSGKFKRDKFDKFVLYMHMFFVILQLCFAVICYE